MRRYSVAILVICALVAALPQMSFAYSVFGGEWSNPDSLTWRWVSAGYSTLSSAFSTGISDWDNTDTELDFTSVGSGEDISGHGYSDSDGNWGYATMSPGWYGSYEHGDCYLNWYYLSNESSNARRHTAGHEIGHTLGLNHSSVTGALMCLSTDPETYYTPQSDDINGINYLYPRNK